jgi:hypothetical protein
LKDNSKPETKFNWSKFAGLASQWSVALVILLFLGKYLDQKKFIHIKMPLFIWILPFGFILFSLFNIIKETNTNK